MAIGYNLVVYPAVIILFILVVRPVWKCWNALQSAESISDEQVTVARQKALRLPIWFAAITACGWYIGGLLIPLVVEFFNPENPIAHFLLSHLVSGMIALAYSLCGSLFIVLRVLYPAMWQNTRELSATARAELAPMALWLGLAQYLAGAVPLLTAAFLLIKGDTADSAFRWLATGLIGLGLLGFYTATTVVRRLSQVVETMSKRAGTSRGVHDLTTGI
jgi:eukaryotic-like serine/threonine-protein kinase